MKKLNVLFLVNKKKDNTLAISKEIVTFLMSKDVQVYAEQAISKDIENTLTYQGEKIDFALVLGGDGTILNAAHKYQDKKLPFYGINLGRVGCLADATLENVYDKLNQILSNEHFIEERNVINCKIYNNDKLVHEMVAFNEVSIHRAELFKMLLVNLSINGHNKSSFYADGVILATATGSSAYSLSCGGPLLLPTAKNFVITPIAPQLRVITSLVINDTDTITIDVEDKNHRQDYKDHFPVVFIDGAYRYKINEESKLVVSKSDIVLKIIKTNKEASLFEPNFKVSSSTNDLFITNAKKF